MFPLVSFSGLKLVESFPYETVQRDYDYVRLASITAGKFARPSLSFTSFFCNFTLSEDVLFSQNSTPVNFPWKRAQG